jgi:hypothetical protein
MKIVFYSMLALVSVALSLPAQAGDCVFPKSPDTIPDGRTATEAEMKAATQAFRAYNDEVNAFSACLEEETKAKVAGTAQLLQMKTLQAKKHNAAVSELQSKAKAFNEQVRIYNSR